MFKHWFYNLKVNVKFAVVGLLILPFILTVGGTGVWGAFNINGLIQQIHTDQIPSIVTLLSASNSVQSVRFYQLQALVEPELTKSQQDINQARQNLQAVRKNWDEYLTTPISAEEAVQVRQFEAEWQVWSASVNASLTNLTNTASTANRDFSNNLTFNNQGQALQDTLAKLIEINQSDATEEANQAEANFWFVVGVIVIAAVVVISLTAVAIYVLARSVTRPLAKLQAATQIIASGDLSGVVEIDTRDEIGELGMTFNTTLFSLRGLIGKLHTQSQQITQATAELTLQAKSQVSASSQQSSAIVEATQTLQQLRSTAQEIAQQAETVSGVVVASLKQVQAVSHLTDEMAQAQEQGRTGVTSTLKALSNLKTQVGVIQEQQETLLQQSEVIQRVIALLDSIAKETHLLSLNAAIEAAGAGSYGERFGVVAHEVKQLANRAAVATQEVGVALGGISHSVAQSSTMVKAGLLEAERAVNEATHSDNTFVALANLAQEIKAAARSIVKEVETSAVLTTKIENSTREQQVANNQMFQTMLEIEAVTTQNLGAIKQSEAATYQLSGTANELKEAAEAFKLFAA